MKLISSAKLLIYAAASIGACPRSNTPPRAMTAFALCRDQKLPIRVFSIFKPGALKNVVLGADEGTLVHA